MPVHDVFGGGTVAGDKTDGSKGEELEELGEWVSVEVKASVE